MERRRRAEPSSSESLLFDSPAVLQERENRWSHVLETLLIVDTSALQLSAIAGPLALFAAWLLLAPEQVLSREMTWDLMLNLSGAWHLHTGQVAHADYHEPIGVLSFRLTQLGFLIVGPSPRALLVGQAMFLALTFPAAVIAAARRLPLIPATVFVVYAALLVLVPTNLGDPMNAYSFAVSYNRWGWSALLTLCLIILIRPRGERPLRIDAAVAALLLILLFYLKITFAVAGLAALGLGLLASPHIRRGWRTWTAVLVLVFANAAAPYNWAYLSDVWFGMTAGYARSLLIAQASMFLDNKAEYTLYGITVLVLVWLWRRGQAPLTAGILAGGTLVIGMFALSQNAQLRYIPLGVLILFVMYDVIRCEYRRTARKQVTDILLPLAAVMIWPLLCVAAATMTLAGYHRAAQRESTLFAVEATNLRGLAVPTDKTDVAETLARTGLAHSLLSTTREPPMMQQLSQQEYVRTLVEAASLFTSRRDRPKIWVADQVNPLPFMLGYPPPRGETLWIRLAERHVPPGVALSDVDIVLLPKYSSYAQVTASVLAAYSEYLSTHFTVQEQTPSWTILSRHTSPAMSNPAS